jgi:hypothetical protein
VDKWPEKGSIDYVYYDNGLKFVRELTDWNDGNGYELVSERTNRKKSEEKCMRSLNQ